jgi:hypothetical protein
VSKDIEGASHVRSYPDRVRATSIRKTKMANASEDTPPFYLAIFGKIGHLRKRALQIETTRVSASRAAGVLLPKLELPAGDCPNHVNRLNGVMRQEQSTRSPGSVAAGRPRQVPSPPFQVHQPYREVCPSFRASRSPRCRRTGDRILHRDVAS